MANLNSVYLDGYLTRDAELRFLSTGTELATFAIAQSRSFQRNGEWEKTTSYFDCKAWGALAKRVSPALLKGSHVALSGICSGYVRNPVTARKPLENNALQAQVLGVISNISMDKRIGVRKRVCQRIREYT